MSLPLSRETQNRGALEEIVHKGGRERDGGENSTHTLKRLGGKIVRKKARNIRI